MDRTVFELQPLGDEGSVCLPGVKPSRTITDTTARIFRAMDGLDDAKESMIDRYAAAIGVRVDRTLVDIAS